MSSDVVVVASIGSQDPAQMRFTKNEDMIQAVAADRPEQPVGSTILPRPDRPGRSTALDHVLGDAGLGHLKREVEEFSVNAWRAPKRIFDAHPPDQRAQIRLDLRPPAQ